MDGGGVEGGRKGKGERVSFYVRLMMVLKMKYVRVLMMNNGGKCLIKRVVREERL